MRKNDLFRLVSLANDVNFGVENGRLLLKIYSEMQVRGFYVEKEPRTKELWTKIRTWVSENRLWVESFSNTTPLSVEILCGLGEVIPLLNLVHLWADPYERKLGEDIGRRLRKLFRFDDSE